MRRGFARRLRVRRWRGLTPVGALAAVVVMLMIALAFALWMQGRMAAAHGVSAARKLVVLAQAAEAHARADWGTWAALPAGAAREIDIDRLRADRLLPEGFDRAGDAMKRPAAAWAVSMGGGRLRLLSMQLVPDGDARWPAEAAFEARGRQALGVVDAAGLLRGPTVQEDLAAFRAAAGGHPRAMALAVYRQLDAGAVCGGALFRRARPGCPDATRMETGLDMGGNDLVGVKVLTAGELEVERELRAGAFRVGRTLSVGSAAAPGAVEVTGSFTALGAADFRGDAAFTGDVRAASVAATGALEAGSADIAGAVTAGSIEADGNLTAPGVTVSGSVSVRGTGTFGFLNVGSCSGC